MAERGEAYRISIHAPRTGSDTRFSKYFASRRRFQSTLPARGATAKLYKLGRKGNISIHAPRTGSDVYDEDLPF